MCCIYLVKCVKNNNKNNKKQQPTTVCLNTLVLLKPVKYHKHSALQTKSEGNN